MSADDDRRHASQSKPLRLVTPEEKEAAIARLSSAFARDVLTVAEYERRVTEVYRAANTEVLRDLTSDLPGASATRDVPVAARETSSDILALFSNVERKGPMRIPARVKINSVFGNVTLDLRDAEFRIGLTEIEASAIFGNIEVLLPPGAVVENHGNAFIGNYASHAPARAVEGQPAVLIRLNGISIFGNVEFTAADARTRLRGWD